MKAIEIFIIFSAIGTFHFQLFDFHFKKFQNFDFDVTSAMTTVSVGMTNLFIYCYFGKLATDTYKKMSDCVFEMNWPELPNDLQKYIILMVRNMQKPLYYHGFGIVNLDLETFTKVRNSFFQLNVTKKWN